MTTALDRTRRHPPGTWQTPQVTRFVVDRYTNNRRSIRAIARELGCSYATVHTILRRAAVTMRPVGGAPISRPGRPATNRQPVILLNDTAVRPAGPHSPSCAGPHPTTSPTGPGLHPDTPADTRTIATTAGLDNPPENSKP
jgi:hypothetical protein